MIEEVESLPFAGQVSSEFQSLLQKLQERGLKFVKPEELPALSLAGKGASFRYDVHVRDIANAHGLVLEHASQGIPGTFFLQVEYSSLERQHEAKFVELGQAAVREGLQTGLHPSPADSFFIWEMHGGNSRQYAAWLREHGEAYLLALAADPARLEELNAGITRHFAKTVERARSIIGPVQLVASHGGEIIQILRPKAATMTPAVADVWKGLSANGWMTAERLSVVGIEADVQQYLTPQLRQATDRGGGYTLMQDSLQRIAVEKSLQILIHPYGWKPSPTLLRKSFAAGAKPLMSPAIKQDPAAQSASAATVPPPLAKPDQVAAKDTAATASMPAAFLDLGKPDSECKSACGRVHDKWVTWFQRTFKNAEKHIDGVRYSVPRIPLAVIETSQTEAEYLKLIGDKSRNMLRKAAKNGYTVRVFNSANHLDYMHAIRTSKEVRSGKPVPESFREKPQAFDSANDRLCVRHMVSGIGVFKDEANLVAYTAIHNSGDLAIVNTILGHGDHLKFGIMNLLVFGIFKEIKEKFPAVKYINYLTLRSSTTQLDTFKKSVGFVPRELRLPLAPLTLEEVAQNADAVEKQSVTSDAGGQAALRQPSTAVAVVGRSGVGNAIRELIDHKGFRKVLIRGDCCSIRTIARNPDLFGKPQIVQNEKCTMQVYLDHAAGISYAEDATVALSNIEAMAPSLRRYYVNQNKAEVLRETGADLLVIDSYADSFFQLWENKKTKAKLWVNAKFLHNRAVFEREHVKLPRRTFHEALVDTQKFIELVRRNNPDLPVLYLTHPIHYYRYLNSRREFCYLGAELERFVPNVYWGTHLTKEECEPVDMNSCGPGETHHYTPETYAKMVLAAAARDAVRTDAKVVW